MKILTFLVAFLPLLLFSCGQNDEELIPTGNTNISAEFPFDGAISVVDGMLRVQSSCEGLSAMFALANMAPDERVAWERSVGFKSLQTVIDSVYESASDDPFSLPYLHPEYFVSDGDSSFRQILPTLVSVVADVNGLCYVDSLVRPVASLVRVNSTLKTTNLEFRDHQNLHDHWHNDTYWMDVDFALSDVGLDENGDVRESFFEVRVKNFKKNHKKWREHKAKVKMSGVDIVFEDATRVLGSGNYYLSEFEDNRELVNFRFSAPLKYDLYGYWHKESVYPVFLSAYGLISTTQYQHGVNIDYTLP